MRIAFIALAFVAVVIVCLELHLAEGKWANIAQTVLGNQNGQTDDETATLGLLDGKFPSPRPPGSHRKVLVVSPPRCHLGFWAIHAAER
ncbi:hypothetical protein MRX96_059630 [Rhipicephalus microplus]